MAINKKAKYSKLILTVIMMLFALTMVLPFFWMISSSCKIEKDVFTFPIQWIPSKWNLINNYKTVWGSQYNFGLYYWNSIIVPQFMILNKLSLYDTHAGLVLIGSFSVFGIFFLRQYMLSIPESIMEAAKIDGASYFTIFLKIIIPITKPALATLAISNLFGPGTIICIH